RRLDLGERHPAQRPLLVYLRRHVQRRRVQGRLRQGIRPPAEAAVVMRLVLIAACSMFVAGCASMNEKISASRQDRCERADWALVGERDGVEGVEQSARYAHICGELFQPDVYKTANQKGFARRPRPPV